MSEQQIETTVKQDEVVDGPKDSVGYICFVLVLTFSLPLILILAKLGVFEKISKVAGMG